ncbi:hypothetical protein ACFPYI_04290 [Halomarina salina]|uniref:Uncharacterized protein n=1 Tax=Halomarina salina TaxID=1872699 RepID=A0ABD5RJS0_9EURY|nr:hypothetical protein [Halomarina salina]
MDEQLRGGISGVLVGVLSTVWFAVTYGHPFAEVRVTGSYYDGSPALLYYVFSIGLAVYGIHKIRTYRDSSATQSK